MALLPRPGRRGSGKPRITSLAVLPLANVSGDAAQEYFADGMTDVLIADLAQIGALKIISRTSIMQLKGVKKPLPEIARQLQVDAIVDGSVLRSGDRVRITAELVDGSTDRHLWGKTYERRIDDVLTLQGEVARAIAGEIQAQVTPQEVGRLSRSSPVAPAALEAYLKGRYHWNIFTEESFLKAIEYFEEATRLDHAYAAAYAGLAEAWAGLEAQGAKSYEEAIPKAEDAATKALGLDESLSDGHTAMAMVRSRQWNWKAWEAESRRSIEINPGNSLAHVIYSTHLRHLGRADESIAEAQRSLQLDPLAMLTNQTLANAYASARRYDLAVAAYQKGLELHPNDSSLYYLLGWSYVHQKMFDNGIAAIEKSLSIDGGDPRISPDLAYVDALIGKTAETRNILGRLLALAKEAPVAPGYIAQVYVALGDRENALTWLERAYQQHSPTMLWLKIDPRFDSIRQEPRFQTLMRQVGLI